MESPNKPNHSSGNLWVNLPSRQWFGRAAGAELMLGFGAAGPVRDDAGGGALEGVRELRQQQHGERGGSDVCPGDFCW